ncbi:MAG TPA: ribosome maturation factor RimP [Geobacteraceae bacterium]|nr:ribosome maturation factor RimP [Geobacteraceae bacterium]
MTRQVPSEKIKDIADRILSSLGMDLVDIEYKREGRQMVLRFYIDKAGGVTLDDCAEVSRELSAILDVEDMIPGKYVLEVSSPGLNRPLKKESDYLRYIGRLVKIKTFELLADEAGNKRKTFLGELTGIREGVVTIRLLEGQNAEIPLDKVAKANLEFEF